MQFNSLHLPNTHNAHTRAFVRRCMPYERADDPQLRLRLGGPDPRLFEYAGALGCWGGVARVGWRGGGGGGGGGGGPCCRDVRLDTSRSTFASIYLPSTTHLLSRFLKPPTNPHPTQTHTPTNPHPHPQTHTPTPAHPPAPAHPHKTHTPTHTHTRPQPPTTQRGCASWSPLAPSRRCGRWTATAATR